MNCAIAPSLTEPGLEWLLRMNAVSGISTTAALRLWERFGPDLGRVSELELAQVAEIEPGEAAGVRRQLLAFDAQRELERTLRLGARIVTRADAEYPDVLAGIPDPPLLLYVKGTGRLDDKTEAGALAFVGTRRATAYGRRMARALAGEAAARGSVIVSGLARGIDSEAHEAALAARAKTWAVLGSGLGRVYPPENEGLARRIAESGGCLVSEWPLDSPPFKGHFPRRNRIVSGLTWGTIVIEGTLHSGSLITARLALEQSREVFAVPGPADAPMSAAPHRLLRQGAKLVETMADVWDSVPPGVVPLSLYVGDDGHKRATAKISLEQNKVLEFLGSESRTLDELVLELGIDFSSLSNIIFELELRDLIIAVPGQRYAKKGR